VRPVIGVVLKGYPRLSETFIAQELLALEQAGFELRFFSMRRPTDPTVHPIHRQIRAPVVYLPEYLHEEPLRVMKALLKIWRTPGFRAAFKSWVRDLRRDISRNRFRRFGQAAVLTAEMPPDVRWLYAHFIHTPSSVARYTSLMAGLSWSCSAHAKDIWTLPDWELEANLAAARWAVTCTRNGHERLSRLAASGRPVRLLYHGIDLDRFPPNSGAPSFRTGHELADPVRLLTVGRAVEKKGLDLLLDALSRLPPEQAWTLTHIGGGVLLKRLKAKASALGLADRIVWAGPQDQATVLAAYRAADLLVLPSRVAANGDRDGLPNVLVEAQSQGLACLSTTVGGIPELIRDGETGCLVPPNDVDALAVALGRLIGDPALRQKLGAAGERRVRAEFDARGGFETLTQLFDQSLPGSREVPMLQAAK
jgi:glycosyltransferase involved in cell wall biosynthesis